MNKPDNPVSSLYIILYSFLLIRKLSHSLYTLNHSLYMSAQPDNIPAHTAEPKVRTLRHTFGKAEHLCLVRDIEALFAAGNKSLSAYPIRAVYKLLEYDKGPRCKVLLSVGKRHLRHAVDRNRTKRQLREAYRLHKHLLLEKLPADRKIHLAFVWLSNDLQSSQTIHKRVRTTLVRMAEKIAAETAGTGGPSL